MKRETLISLLAERFYENFAVQTSAIVISNGALDDLYHIATGEVKLPPTEAKKVIFRAAYTLETIFFNHKELFTPYIERFCDDFPKISNESAKRHFTKMMCELLKVHTPTPQQMNLIAQSCADWCIDGKVKVAVKIVAIKILLLLKGRVDWVEGVIPVIVDIVERRPSPAIDGNLRRWRNDRSL